jgi:hypothetical protein
MRKPLDYSNVKIHVTQKLCDKKKTVCILVINNKTKSVAFSPQTNYTDLPTAAAGEVVPNFAGRGRCVDSAANFFCSYLSFLDRSRYFPFK